jgi:hypothetical protein
VPFLKDIVLSRVDDVRRVLTKYNKEEIIYRCLEENKDIPQVSDLLLINANNRSPSSMRKDSNMYE